MSGQPERIVYRYFAGLAENTFQTQLGVVDPDLIDYISGLLVRFIRSDTVHRIRSVTGRPLMTVTEMAAEAAERLGNARREIHRHIGDFTLFWAGVFPEALRQHTPVGDQFEDYCKQGKRSYHLAAQIEPTDETQPDSLVLVQLSDRFELCCYGLREVRRQWEEGDENLPQGVILFN
ncbi:MAG TPA: hypothetical protein PKD54_11650 [Pirellulaceae bacterium]|nr:hypothetical protein [Pirellulaceae bacterium]